MPEPAARKRLREAREKATAEQEEAVTDVLSDLHISAARIDLWLQYNGSAPWPGEDQAVIDETYPEAPLLRRDIAWMNEAYHRLRAQVVRLKAQRDRLAREASAKENGDA